MSERQFDALVAASSRVFCWSVGESRVGHECRIYPRSQAFNEPTIIETGDSVSHAVEAALSRLGGRVPYRRVGMRGGK